MPSGETPNPELQTPKTFQIPIQKWSYSGPFGRPCLGVFWCLGFGIWCLSRGVLTAQSQPSSVPPQQDPLMSLMLSQPKVDITTNVSAVASFDPPVVRPGEQTVYRVTFNALEQTIDWPKKISAPPELQTEPGAHGQIIPIMGGSQIPFTTFNTRVRASAVGDFTIPE